MPNTDDPDFNFLIVEYFRNADFITFQPNSKNDHQIIVFINGSSYSFPVSDGRKQAHDPRNPLGVSQNK